MICKELFDAAISMVSEVPSDTAGISDYEERAPYLMASFLCECAPLDAAYRKSRGEPEKPFLFDGAAYPSENPFPLSGIFTLAAVYYMASMLVIDENESMSDKLFARYSDLMARIRADLPASSHPVTDVYGVI